MARRGEDTRQRLLVAAEKQVMANGFAGTSIDDILKATDLTKGAFFHHFKGKSDLARVLIEEHAQTDIRMFESFLASAEASTDDPLGQAYAFLEAFEAFVSESDDPSPGCMYAVYTYEGMRLDPTIHDFVAGFLRRWTDMYRQLFAAVIGRYPPALPVTADDLAMAMVAVIEGGFVLERAYGDAGMTARQSAQFRNYLRLLFEGERPANRESAPEPASREPIPTSA